MENTRKNRLILAGIGAVLISIYIASDLILFLGLGIFVCFLSVIMRIVSL